MDVIDLTKKLVTIPSYVDEDTNEKEIADYICSYLKKNLSWLKVAKQKVEGNRYNIVAVPSEKAKLFFSSHMDTVKPAGEKAKMLKPKVIKNKIYGLGANDMKAGLAASIIAVEKAGKDKSVGLIFTCDEEYYFKGIGRYMQVAKSRPDLIVFPEPSDLQIVNGSRGIVEIEFEVIGKTAHAGRPNYGINAIEMANKLIMKLRLDLRRQDEIKLGKTTVCLSALQGGRLLDGNLTIQANAIADYAKVLLDIRTAGTNLDGSYVKNLVLEISKDLKVETTNFKVNLDYRPYLLQKDNLKKLETSVKRVLGKVSYFTKFRESGIGEATLISNKLGWNAVNFGPSGFGTSHKVDECVDIKSIQKTEQVFIDLIKSY